ncbi:sulfurtransferase [Erythrobacter sp.]|jgi:thiosulfate/3-mercaptopyruvate sulfurtransferase|uniref:sulfurtransferase n=1 Tax=Erythrobacter sp. TaxID=1042 RepID=UPI002EA9AA79|nr:sulfurtransferase [Erythrobacter sp.]
MTDDVPRSQSLISCEELAAALGESDLCILDASLHLPATGRDANAEFERGHIPGARFLHLASLTDRKSSVPAALANPRDLAARLADLGVGPETRIVLYDDSDIRTSARAWFMLAAHGVTNVAILDGGLVKWRKEGRPLDQGLAPALHAPELALAQTDRVATKADMLANLDSSREQVLDARSAERVFGSGIDPVHGGANGRIPGALNLPFAKVFAADGTYRSPAELRALFAEAGIDWDRPIVTTCGSGVTACVLLFAAHLAGKDDLRLYDGSWLEWEADPATPKAQGPA